MKIKTIILIICAACFVLPTYAQSLALTNMKIGYVILNQAINTSQEGQRSKKFLEAQANRTKQVLSEKERAIITSEQDLQNNIMLNEATKTQKRAEIEKMKNEYRQEVANAQQSLRQNEARHTQKILNDLIQVIDKIAKAEDYDLVLEFNLKQTILYSKAQMTDITAQVVREYDKLQSE